MYIHIYVYTLYKNTYLKLKHNLWLTLYSPCISMLCFVPMMNALPMELSTWLLTATNPVTRLRMTLLISCMSWVDAGSISLMPMQDTETYIEKIVCHLSLLMVIIHKGTSLEVNESHSDDLNVKGASLIHDGLFC